MSLPTVAEARELILSAVHPLSARALDLGAALDCVLAEEIVSPLNLPPWDNSAMDGFAVRAGDVDSASEDNPIHLRVLAEIPAGVAASMTVEPQTAARIFTGAPIPSGADAVVMQEDTRPHHEGYVAIIEAVEPGENIRRIGEDVAAGQIILRAGTKLGPAQLAMAAALGMRTVTAHPRPRVGVLATGAEIVESGHPLQPGQIYDSNSAMLCAWVQRAGGEPLALGIADDTREDLLEKMDYGLSECDVLLTAGGVSVGAHDLVKDVLAELSCEQKLWKVAMKPGKPFVFATCGSKLIFGLPGNPVSAAVAFLILVQPALLKLRGRTDCVAPTVPAVAEVAFVNHSDRPHYMRARLEHRDGRLFATPLPQQGSHMIASLVGADGLVEVPAECTIPAGVMVQVLPV